MQTYIVGTMYENKGVYVCMNKFAHKFERHNFLRYKARINGLGEKYFFEKV